MSTENAATTAVAETTVQQLLNETSSNGTTTSLVKGKITVDKVGESQFQKNKTLTAQLRQIIKSIFTYPEAQIANNMQDNLFEAKDFGFEMKSIEREEHRIAFLDVPLNSTVESITALLEKNPNACLYKVLSNYPILTDGQKRAIDSDNLPLTLDDVANSQTVRYPEGAKDKDGNDISDDIILDKNGKVQFRAVFFKVVQTPDVDLRTPDVNDFYASPEISAEVLTALDTPIQSI